MPMPFKKAAKESADISYIEEENDREMLSTIELRDFKWISYSLQVIQSIWELPYGNSERYAVEHLRGALD